MPREFKIRFDIDSMPALSAVQKAAVALAQAQVAAKAMAAGQEQALAGAGQAAERSAGQAASAWTRATEAELAQFARSLAAASQTETAKQALIQRTSQQQVQAVMSGLSAQLQANTQAVAGLGQVMAASQRAQAAVQQLSATAASGLGQMSATATQAGQQLLAMSTAGAGGLGQVGASADKTGGSIRGMAGNFALAQIGIQKLIELANALGRAMQDAAQRSRELGQNFVTQRDTMRELAFIMGEPLNDEFMKRIAEFNVQTGFKPEEGTQFLTEFYNRAAQYIGPGKNIEPVQAEAFRRQAGQLIAAKGLPPEVGGELAGGILATQKFEGPQAAQRALAEANVALTVLSRGAGQNLQNMRQLSKTLASLQSKNEFQGIFRTVAEAATAVSVAGEANPQEAFEMVQAAVRGLRSKQAQGLVKQAGITPKTGFEESIRRLAPVVLGEAKQRGIMTEDVLRERGFEDVLTRQAISVFINRGVGEKLFEDRMRAGREAARPGVAQRQIQAFQASDVGASRQAEAQLREAEQQRGQELARIDTLRKQALTELIRERAIDTTATNVTEYVTGLIPFGNLAFDRQKRIDTRAREILRRRDVGGAATDVLGDVVPLLPEDRQAEMNRAIAGIERAGGRPLADFADPRQVQAAEAAATAANLARARAAVGLPPAAPVPPPVAPQPPEPVAALPVPPQRRPARAHWPGPEPAEPEPQAQPMPPIPVAPLPGAQQPVPPQPVAQQVPAMPSVPVVPLPEARPVAPPVAQPQPVVPLPEGQPVQPVVPERPPVRAHWPGPAEPQPGLAQPAVPLPAGAPEPNQIPERLVGLEQQQVQLLQQLVNATKVAPIREVREGQPVPLPPAAEPAGIAPVPGVPVAPLPQGGPVQPQPAAQPQLVLEPPQPAAPLPAVPERRPPRAHWPGPEPVPPEPVAALPVVPERRPVREHWPGPEPEPEPAAPPIQLQPIVPPVPVAAQQVVQDLVDQAAPKPVVRLQPEGRGNDAPAAPVAPEPRQGVPDALPRGQRQPAIPVVIPEPTMPEPPQPVAPLPVGRKPAVPAPVPPLIPEQAAAVHELQARAAERVALPMGAGPGAGGMVMGPQGGSLTLDRLADLMAQSVSVQREISNTLRALGGGVVPGLVGVPAAVPVMAAGSPRVIRR